MAELLLLFDAGHDTRWWRLHLLISQMPLFGTSKARYEIDKIFDVHILL